jgi:hypothetical protein
MTDKDSMPNILKEAYDNALESYENRAELDEEQVEALNHLKDMNVAEVRSDVEAQRKLNLLLEGQEDIIENQESMEEILKDYHEDIDDKVSSEHEQTRETIENLTILDLWPGISLPEISNPFGGDRDPEDGNYGGNLTKRAFLVGAAGLAAGGAATGYEAQDGYDLVVGDEAILNSIGRRYIDSGYGNLEELGQEILEKQDSDRKLGFDDGILGGGRIGLQVGEDELGVDSQHSYEEAKSIAQEEIY